MKKLFTGIFAATLLTAGAGVALEHGYVKAEEPSKASEDAAGDAWEKAAKEAETPKVETPKVETPKAETPKQPVIDEEYVKKNIDTPTGKEEKAREDAYKDKAEAKYKEELKKQEAKKDADKKVPVKGQLKAPVKKVLPKTSAVR